MRAIPRVKNATADCHASFDLDVGFVNHRRPLLNECVPLPIDLWRRVCDWGGSEVDTLLVVFWIRKRPMGAQISSLRIAVHV
jgi:hypothetical protein